MFQHKHSTGTEPLGLEDDLLDGSFLDGQSDLARAPKAKAKANPKGRARNADPEDVSSKRARKTKAAPCLACGVVLPQKTLNDVNLVFFIVFYNDRVLVVRGSNAAVPQGHAEEGRYTGPAVGQGAAQKSTGLG